MAEDVKPSDRDLARRIVLAAGIDETTLTDSARQQFARVQEAAAQEPIDPEAPMLTDRERWHLNSGKQMQRFFGGRCLTCVHWTPGIDGAPGTCPYIAAAPGSDASILGAGFGCTLWGEISTDDAETIDARTTVAMAIGMLEPFPD